MLRMEGASRQETTCVIAFGSLGNRSRVMTDSITKLRRFVSVASQCIGSHSVKDPAGASCRIKFQRCGTSGKESTCKE